jgi:hypothetical protein
MCFKPQAASDGRARMATKEIERGVDPAVLKFAIPVDELDELHFGMRFPQCGETGISPARGIHRLIATQLRCDGARTSRNVDAFVGRGRIGISDWSADRFKRSEATRKPLAFVAADDHDAEPGGADRVWAPAHSLAARVETQGNS